MNEEKKITPEELLARIEERKRNRTPLQRIRWNISSCFLMRKVRKQMDKEFGKGNW